MIQECDILVVGGGPGGSMAARYAAEGGLDVIMIEKKQEIGAPLRCGEGISKVWLDELGIEADPRWISADVDGAKIVSPSGHVFRVDESMAGNEVGYVVERHLFDKELAAMAARAGAKIWMKTSATDVIMEGGKVVGVKAVRFGEPVEIRAKCVVAADGYESQLARWAGVETKLSSKDITTCLQYRMTNIDVEQNFCEFVIGSAAPGGYLWIFPKGKDIANVGLGILLKEVKAPGDVKRYLDEYIASDPRLRDGQVLEVVSGAVSVSAPLDETTADGLVIVGDAARMIDPITGGGICHACRAGMYAGKVLVECAKKGDFSKEALQPYEQMWRDRMEDKLYRNWMAKEKLITLRDEDFDAVVKVLAESDITQVNVHNILKALKDNAPDLVEEFEDLI